MNESPRPDRPSYQLHKRQFAWQILVPVIAFALLVIAAAVLTVTRGAETDRTVADISTMWLLIPVIIVAIIMLALVGGLIYGTAMLHKIVPGYAAKAQDVLRAIEHGARKISNGTAKPFIWIDEAGAAIKAFFKRRKR